MATCWSRTVAVDFAGLDACAVEGGEGVFSTLHPGGAVRS
jgi:hypothetical protein